MQSDYESLFIAYCPLSRCPVVSRGGRAGGGQQQQQQGEGGGGGGGHPGQTGHRVALWLLGGGERSSIFVNQSDQL